MLFFFAFFHCVFKKEEMAKYLSHRIIGSSSEGEKKQQQKEKKKTRNFFIQPKNVTNVKRYITINLFGYNH